MVGKPAYEYAFDEDNEELYSLPYPVLLELEIRKVFCGMNHIISLDSQGKVYALGEGGSGCLGLGDDKDRVKVCAITALENY